MYMYMYMYMFIFIVRAHDMSGDVCKCVVHIWACTNMGMYIYGGHVHVYCMA